MYHPSRLTTPLKRTGKRGEGGWERIEWGRALDEIAERLRNITQSYGPEAVVMGQGTGRHHYMHVIRFANALRDPQLV